MNVNEMLLAGPAFLYEQTMQVRNFLYDQDIVPTIKLKKPLISVGNLSLGGTGKTPVVAWLLEYLINRGFGPALVSGAYKGRLTHAQRVSLVHENGALYFGDEVWMLANKFPQIPAYAGTCKWKTALLAQESEPNCDVFILDDGYQHRRLFRDLNILLIDVSQALESQYVFPLGRFREKWQNFDRAHWVFLTKTNLANSETLKFWQRKLQNKRVFSFDYKLKKLNLDFDKKYLAFCGLAQPESFFTLLQNQNLEQDVSLKNLQIEKMIFPDHHMYKKSDQDKIFARARELSGAICTEKDAVKLRPYWPTDIPLFVPQLELVPQFSLELIREDFSTLLHK